MNKFLLPVTNAVLLLAVGVAGSAVEPAPGLMHGAAALRAVNDSVADPAALAAGNEAARRHKAEPGRAPFLLSPFGHMPALATDVLPADPKVRTRNGLYATRLQADELTGQLGGTAVVWVDVGCCSESALDIAQGNVAGLMAANDLDDDAPVFVSGADLAAAARLVDRLSEQRLTRVYLITR